MLQRNETVKTIFGVLPVSYFFAVCLNRSVLRASFAALKEFKNHERTVNIPNDFENR